jgi:hypothetical protein
MTTRQVAWILILIVDVGYIAWGAGAAASPDHLLGPGGKAILPAGYEGFSGGSWSELAGASPLIAGFMTLLYRMYGVYNVLNLDGGGSTTLAMQNPSTHAGQIVNVSSDNPSGRAVGSNRAFLTRSEVNAAPRSCVRLG